jgi:hypothetical protein
LRIALIDSNRKGKIYPLALLKIGAWQKSLNNYCELFDNKLPDAGLFDEIWITTVFTFDIPYVIGMVREAKKRCKDIKVGGVSASLLPEHFEKEGINVYKGLIPEAEEFSPDYSLLGFAPEYSISHTSRGCIRKCKFCMVPKLEPVFGGRTTWINDVHPMTKRVLFFDNNWLASDTEKLTSDVSILKELVSQNKITSVDFNQGLDARLVDESMVDLLKGVPIDPVRFAFDGMHEDKYYQNAIRLMYSRGFKNFRSYVLYNFMDKPSDFYYRLRVSVELGQELGTNVESFPMRYQPILDINKQRDYVGKHWTLKKRNGFQAILANFSMFGQITSHGDLDRTGIEEFEFWFGKDANEFERLLTYPKLRQLLKSKKGFERNRRAIRNSA